MGVRTSGWQLPTWGTEPGSFAAELPSSGFQLQTLGPEYPYFWFPDPLLLISSSLLFRPSSLLLVCSSLSLVGDSDPLSVAGLGTLCRTLREVVAQEVVVEGVARALLAQQGAVGGEFQEASPAE